MGLYLGVVYIITLFRTIFTCPLSAPWRMFAPGFSSFPWLRWEGQHYLHHCAFDSVVGALETWNSLRLSQAGRALHSPMHSLAMHHEGEYKLVAPQRRCFVTLGGLVNYNHYARVCIARSIK